MALAEPRAAPSRNVSPLRIWLTEFLFIRGFCREVPGIALYRYNVTPNEFAELRELLQKHHDHALHPTYGTSWAPAFCLYVAEMYRRQYDAKAISWAWAPFESLVDCQFTPQQRGQLVRLGLEYWKRPVRKWRRLSDKFEDGRDNLLGSLFTEGGLPWPLVQRDTHSFGRVVGKGLKYHYRTEAGLRTTADLLADFVEDLPQTFRDSPETLHLLAGVVEQLMELATRHELRDKEDPARYLDSVEAGWRNDFPLPLDEANARNLVNDWLRDASRSRAEREAQRAKGAAFSCTHRLIEEPHGWRIRSEVSVPRVAELSIDAGVINPGRFELAFFEGDRLLARAGVAYGSRREGSDEVSVRFLKTQFSLDRVRFGDALTLSLLANGCDACIVPFDQAALDETLPLVFEYKGDEWWYLASASCSSVATRVRVRLPRGLNYRCDGAVTTHEDATDDVRWIEAEESLLLFSDDGDRYEVSLRAGPQTSHMLSLKGVPMHYDSVPQVVFQGWPKLDVPEAEGDVPVPSIREFVNRRHVTRADHGKLFGAVHYLARDASANILLQRRFGVVPLGFAIEGYAASGGKLARLVIRQSSQLEVQVVDRTIRCCREVQGQDTVIWLEPQTQPLPTFLTLEVCGNGSASAPITFKVAYPDEAARLIDMSGAILGHHDFMLTDLLGTRVALSTSRPNGTRFCLQLELVSKEARCTRHYYIGVSGKTVLLSLFSYQTDMMQMLGAVDQQDAFLRVRVETDRPLLQFDVRRYNGAHWREDGDPSTFTVTDLSRGALTTKVCVQAMLLTDPKQASVNIHEQLTQNVGTGRFRMPPSMGADGTWLIYPASGSPTQFRPFLQSGERIESDVPESEIRSLHEAARAFHPVKQPYVIAQQIANMADDFDHSGWEYLADLKQHYSHLPLSVFESWLALSRNPAALAVAIFRLEVDESFCARIRDELAVIWECVPLPQWAAAYQRFEAWLGARGLPDAFSDSLLLNRRQMLDYVLGSFGGSGLTPYLKTGDARVMQKYRIDGILPHLYQDLRRVHDGDHWPTELGPVLRDWLGRQKLPPSVLALSRIEYTDAVAIMPIFMAYVTAGRTTIEELKTSRSYTRFAIKLVSDFDRWNWYAPVHGLMVSYLLATQE